MYDSLLIFLNTCYESSIIIINNHNYNNFLHHIIICGIFMSENSKTYIMLPFTCMPTDRMQLVDFTKSKTYISQDLTSHIFCTWRMHQEDWGMFAEKPCFIKKYRMRCWSKSNDDEVAYIGHCSTIKNHMVFITLVLRVM